MKGWGSLLAALAPPTLTVGWLGFGVAGAGHLLWLVSWLWLLSAICVWVGRDVLAQRPAHTGRLRLDFDTACALLSATACAWHGHVGLAVLMLVACGIEQLAFSAADDLRERRAALTTQNGETR